MSWFQFVVKVYYDMPRVEEKRLMKALEDEGFEVKPFNVTREPLPIGGVEDHIALIRAVSMFRSLYTAAVLEANGITPINSSFTIIYSGDKILTYSVLAANSIPIPKTVISLNGDSTIKAYLQIGFPLVDKPPIGSWGRLVSLIRDWHEANIVIEHRSMMNNPQMKAHIVQEYVEMPEHRDIRCFVVGGNCLGCIYRIPKEGEWRSNVALGADVVKLDESTEACELAVKAAEALKGEVVSIDLFERKDGLVVNEVNGVPEFKGFMRATGIDVAKEVAKYVKEKLKK
ncbi:30S ribosomal protein S6 modification protein [Ignicoccus islandicus DSM 13165]|uniref:30S ribosomal protein S6 modification protein n=1 Tax=Ignicoccus islandicus DSM 13165 TaxID=940295 RepID=A0A0U3FPM1_9CREN|nr:lysine biosynthesis protein LysX [Ignicoccus islandicus]ALU11408.1 30S ribosomal protein S6 modification protein [Ignicoccus islandicus DSM 13165]